MKNYLTTTFILLFACFNADAKPVEKLMVSPFTSLRFNFDDSIWNYAITNNPYPSYSIQFGNKELSLVAREFPIQKTDDKEIVTADTLVDKLISKLDDDSLFTVVPTVNSDKIKAPKQWSCRSISAQRKSDGNKISFMGCVYLAGNYYEELLVFVADEATESSIEELNKVILTIKHI